MTNAELARQGFRNIITRYRPTVAQSVTDAIGNPLLPYDVIAPIKYHFGWIDESGMQQANEVFPGKGIRPTLLAMTYDALGGNHEDIAPLGTALELIHNFSLIHDDIEDRDEQRHGRRTLWATKRWGEASAINSGDYLLILALEQINRLRDHGFSSDQVLNITTVALKTLQYLIEGQHMDIAFEQQQEVSTRDYMDMIKGKTGAMIDAPIFLAGYLAGADSTMLSCLEKYSNAIGITFQVSDDYLGIWGDLSITGKSGIGDITRRKKTYPVIYALEKARQADDSPEKTMLLHFYASDSDVSDSDVQQVRQALEFFGGKVATETLISECNQVASTAILESALISDRKQDFLAIANFFSMRDK